MVIMQNSDVLMRLTHDPEEDEDDGKSITSGRDYGRQ